MQKLTKVKHMSFPSNFVSKLVNLITATEINIKVTIVTASTQNHRLPPKSAHSSLASPPPLLLGVLPSLVELHPGLLGHAVGDAGAQVAQRAHGRAGGLADDGAAAGGPVLARRAQQGGRLPRRATHLARHRRHERPRQVDRVRRTAQHTERARRWRTRSSPFAHRRSLGCLSRLGRIGGPAGPVP